MITPFTELFYGYFLKIDTVVPSLLKWFGEEIVADWIFPSFINFSPILISIVILANRDRLQDLNIDKPFVLIFIYSGILLSWIHFFPNGWLIGISVLTILFYFIKGEIVFEPLNRSARQISSLIIIVFFIYICSFGDYFFGTQNMDNAISLFFSYLFSTAIYEEMIYRGLLWMFLKDKGWGDFKIIIIQAILFWLSHISTVLVDPSQFFIVVPILSLILGYIVMRTKSLTPSTIFHVLYNFMVVLLGGFRFW